LAGNLVIKLGALGDLIMATPFFRLIQSRHAGERVALLTAPEHAALFGSWPGLETVSFPRRGVRATVRAIRWIRAGRFERIYDLQSNDRSALLCALSGAPFRAGNHARFPYTHHPPSRWDGQSHSFERLREVLRAAGIDADPEGPWLPVSEADRAAARSWLEERGLGGRPLIIVHAGASAGHPEKRWPGFAELCAALRERGVATVAAGAAPDAAVNRALAAAGAIDATACFTLPQLVELGRYARAAVTNDSGPMHVLSCAGIPVYGLFGPTDWRRNHAIGQRDRVICAGPFPAPLSRLAPETVLRHLKADGLID
jgi:ADP-heptose:LPS heptosyltransferase